MYHRNFVLSPGPLALLALTWGVVPLLSAGEETVTLSPFVVTVNPDDDRYAPSEVTSGGRTKVNIFDSSQNVTVIAPEVIRDISPGRALDALKYVPGITESSIPNGLDRMTIRGFLTTSRTVDGITTQYSDSQGNIDPFLVERMEVVKGPNAILAPAANPGGTVNYISKKPLFTNAASIAVETGLFSAGRIETDLNQVVGRNQKLALRLLAATEDSEDYFGSKKQQTLLAPMATYRISPTTELTWQTFYVDGSISNYYDGIAVSPDSGSANGAKLYPGVPRDLNIYGPDSYRNDGRVENSLLFLTQFTEDLSFRAQGRQSNHYDLNNSMTTLAGAASSAGTNAASFNPATGQYTPGVTYASTAPHATTPVAISPTFNRSGSRVELDSEHYTVQTDLLHSLKLDHARAETLVGYAYNYDGGNFFGNALSAPAVTLTSFTYSPDVVGAVNRNQEYQSDNQQLYLSEHLFLLNDRLILDGGYSHNAWDVSIQDRLKAKAIDLSPSVDLVNYGLVVKPLKNLDLFYQHSQNGAILPIANLASTPGVPVQDGVQDEVGMRVLLRDKRIRLTVSYYNIEQNNTNVSNPANFAFPSPVPALPGLLTDRTAKGWEFEVQGAITPQLSVVGGFTTFKNRNPFGQIFRGTAEQAASLLFNYSFRELGTLQGLSLSLGADYLCARPGDDASGFTSQGVARDATFYLPARTLVNAGVAYSFLKHWRAQLNVENALNAEYLQASLNRGAVWVGTPINARLKLTYSF